MATVKKRTAKNGSVSFYIRCSDGYDSNGRQIERSMTWKPESGMSDRQIEKELQRQIVLFEEAVKNGGYFDPNTRFEEYAEIWMENNKPPQLAPKTYERYKSLLVHINAAIGHIRLSKLQSHHLQSFYQNLRESGIKQVGSYARTTSLRQILEQKQLTREAFSHLCGVSSATISAACQGRHISIASAEKIAAGLQRPAKQIFEIHAETTGLSGKTILHYHRLISSILAQAARERLIPFNPADRNYMKAPRVERKEADFLDDEQVRHVLALLDNEPIKWKTAMYLLIFSGIRRGELMGLEWKDIDFENHVIHIRNTSQYVQGLGIITKGTKNATSERTIRLSANMFAILAEYRTYWLNMREALLDRWENVIEITLADGTKKWVQNDRLFVKDDSTPMNPDSLTDWVSKFVKRHGLPHFSPHSLRHTHASLLIAGGVNIPTVSRRLGHSSVATTTKVYVHAIQSADEIAANLIEEKLDLSEKPRKPEGS